MDLRRKAMKKVDVVIIGGGISGLMAAYRLIEEKPGLKITLLEKVMTLPVVYVQLLKVKSQPVLTVLPVELWKD